MAEAESTLIATVPKNNSEEVRVALSEYRGTPLIDVRVYAEMRDTAGERVATKKGVCMNVRRLPQLIQALREAEAEARRRGLFDG